MWERVQARGSAIDPHDLGIRKTALIVIIVVGCFAVLWPKIFYPMIVGPQDQRIRPNELDKGCCNVISDQDVNTIELITNLCNKIVQRNGDQVLSNKQIITICRDEVLEACGIDITVIMDEKVRLGSNFKQIVDEIRSFNGSLCLKHNFGIVSWMLGSPHKISISNLTTEYIRQERPSHLRPEMLHPALREKGRAIPHPHQAMKPGTSPRIIEGRPGPVPGVRPPMGGAGHVIPPQKSSNNMGLIMPIYTIGIVIFFTYTLMKVLFRKSADSSGGVLYEPLEPDPIFRKEVFEGERKPRGGTSRDEELDQLRRRLRETEYAMEKIVAQMAQAPFKCTIQKPNGELANGTPKCADREVTSTVHVLGMETVASCEGGQKWNRPESPIIPPPARTPTPPQEIFLEGTLPSKSQLLVTDTKTETESNEGSSDPAVILASKMTLNVISPSNVEDKQEEEKPTSEELPKDRTFSNFEIENLKADLNEIAALAEDTVDKITVSDDEEEEEEEIEDRIETRGARSLDYFLSGSERKDGDGEEDEEEDDEEEEEEDDDEEEEIEYVEENEEGQRTRMSNNDHSNQLENGSDEET